MQKINLFVNTYDCGDPDRQKELDFCFKTNQESGLFDRIIDVRPFNHDGTESKFAPTFRMFFDKMKKHPNDINIIANTDIYFNDTINLVQGIKVKECYAMTRWELDEGKIVPFEKKHSYNKEAKAKHSQDVWVFNGSPNIPNSEYHMGVPGIDNRMAYVIKSHGYSLTNPSNKIQCIHNHKDDSRNYKGSQITDSNGTRYYPTGVILKPYAWVEVNEEPKTRGSI